MSPWRLRFPTDSLLRAGLEFLLLLRLLLEAGSCNKLLISSPMRKKSPVLS